LALLSQSATAASKPAEDRFTFSSTRPEREIDFLMAAPGSRWRFFNTMVVDEPIASDHRPVVADFELK
jgi:endonuclease/exonuclease/phosphatase family metal-dependent hydrolase